jgi:hypothetical protein
MECGVDTAERLAALASELGVVNEVRVVLTQRQQLYYQGESGYSYSWKMRALGTLDQIERSRARNRRAEQG